MFDPLSSTFGEEAQPPWPTTPRTPNTPIPNLPRPSSRPSSRPQTPDERNAGWNATTGSNGVKYEKAEPYLKVRITGLDRNRRDILVKFDAQTNLSNFSGTTYRNASRSYLEFQQFYDAIIHNNPQTIIPALPLAQTSAPTDEEDDRLVRIMLQRWLTRICEDPILMQEEELRSFIESDFGYQPTPVTRKKASSGFSLIRRNVPDEDEELQRARFELTKLETQFFEAAKAIDKLSKVQKSLGAVRSDVGNKLVNVATTEAHPPLGNALRKLGRTYHSLSDLDQAQGISECVIIGDTLGYQGLNARSAKEILQQRTSVLEEYQAAVKTTISKRRNIERLKASRNIGAERVDEALEDLEEAERYEQILARRAEGISQNLHRALARHKRLVAEDVTTALIEHVRSSIMYERQHLRELEALRPDVQNADKKHVLQKPVTTPRPSHVPPLEDFSRPVPPPLNTAPVSNEGRTSSTTPSVSGPLSARSASPLQRYTPTLPSVAANSPLQSPGAGPSSPVSQSAKPSSFTSPVSDGPPLGGRLVDGTKSMFVKPTPSPLGPLADPSSPNRPPSVRAQSPLHSARTSSPHPLAQSASFESPLHSSASVANGRPDDLDPLGMVKPSYMSASVRVQPTRPRLDAREAASKLANMF
ncbi:uncharacterized protein PHACADRAFT_249717 [Phanerochaete carnosa HHB-10118-sp]|uniref:PX domain-containing protein n=1 Tax=Phanerochaete carnosa (strain HHB-10118-sp) TaxID=650164 RepID=K5WIY2_PHACS|nr:uncharacterized protein PHACADRAFT_249717 [Phanerochaete carnosa HHB-10118-sp]EKM59310.1 hypothetical protein PHACADRAFT_249717 [Phanerochaete carnosa HHB-10118-sp]